MNGTGEAGTLRGGRWDESSFLAMRNEVLAAWPTGKDVSEEAFDYYARKGDSGVFDRRLREAKASGGTLLQPRVGTPLLDRQTDFLKYLETEGTADLLGHTVDSYTRNNRYHEAQKYLEQSQHDQTSLLNGVPVVNHGVAACRTVHEQVSCPLQIRHGSPDGRLLAEISLASGYTSYEGGGISYNVAYSARTPIEQTVRNWQYVDRLSGYYTERGVTINRESFGALTGVLIPPAICVAVSVLESLLAAEQGVKSMSVGYAQCGHIVQDVAAIAALEHTVSEYLARFGYEDVCLTTVLHQWMGPFPMGEGRALSLIAFGALTASLARATKVITKTPHEAIGVPTKEANAQGLLCSRLMIDSLAGQYPLDRAAVECETFWIAREASAILERVLQLGDGDPAVSVVRGFEAGVLDVPFSPSNFVLGKVVPVRDALGAVRYLDTGNLPFDRQTRERNHELVQHRLSDTAGLDHVALILADINHFLETEGAAPSVWPG